MPTRAVLALRRAQGAQEREGAPPRRERHFLCGHAGMVRTEQQGDQVLSLCPACCTEQASEGSVFREQFLVFIREPRRGDPGE